MHRVVVTGLGAVTPLGHDVPAFWDGLKSGTDGIRPVELVPAEGVLAGEGNHRAGC